MGARSAESVGGRDRLDTDDLSNNDVNTKGRSRLLDFRFRQTLVPHIDACPSFRTEGIFYLKDIDDNYKRMASRFALVYGEAGRSKEALQLTERVVEVYKRMLGEEHPDTLCSIQNLAIRYSEAGERQKALQLMERVVKVYKRMLDEEHSDTRGSMHTLEYFKQSSENKQQWPSGDEAFHIRYRRLLKGDQSIFLFDFGTSLCS